MSDSHLDVFEKHRLNIARRTLRMNDVFVNLLGGMTKSEAKEIISQHRRKRERQRDRQRRQSREQKNKYQR